jgi:hypothetical protein
MEQLARQQYAASKDPHDCALAYIAMGKKSVLHGLFRSAGNKKVGPQHRAGQALQQRAGSCCRSACWVF